MSEAARLGRGFPFPLRVDERLHRLPYVDGDGKVKQAIRIVLDTEPGERVMRPTFGCRLRSFLGAPNTVATRSAIRHEVELALGAWEPRIELRRVDVTAGADPSLVEIAIAYVHARTQRPDNFVYRLALE
jgi:phage baseplate assembly protein W